MINIFKTKLINVLETLHFKIFGTPMGDEMRKFVANLSWMAASAFVCAVFLFIANLMAGRWLGPAEYGKYAMVISAGQLFIIPMLLGLNTASIYYLTQKKEDKPKIISTALFSNFLLITLSILILFSFRVFLNNLFKIDNSIFWFTVIYATILTLKYMAEAILKGRHHFKMLARLNIVNALVVLVSFLLIIWLVKNYTFQSYTTAIIIGLAIFSLIIILTNLPKPADFNLPIFRKLMHYGLFSTIGSISGFALNNIDRLVLNNFIGFTAVGIFAAYLSASSFFSSQILQIFLDVFFPSISGAENKKEIYQKIKKLFFVSIIPLFILNLLVTAIIIKLYGSRYEFNYLYILLFSLAGILNFVQSVLWWFIASFGKKGIRFTSTTAILIGFFNIAAIIILVKILGLIGATIGLILTSFIIIMISLIYLKRHNG